MGKKTVSISVKRKTLVGAPVSVENSAFQVDAKHLTQAVNEIAVGLSLGARMCERSIMLYSCQLSDC